MNQSSVCHLTVCVHLSSCSFILPPQHYYTMSLLSWRAQMPSKALGMQCVVHATAPKCGARRVGEQWVALQLLFAKRCAHMLCISIAQASQPDQESNCRQAEQVRWRQARAPCHDLAALARSTYPGRTTACRSNQAGEIRQVLQKQAACVLNIRPGTGWLAWRVPAISMQHICTRQQ
jgi:hypothetical protein